MWLLLTAIVVTWYFADFGAADKPIQVNGQPISVADGDSFAIGGRKFRLDGIDAPEYRQTCADASGNNWDCGKVARAALESLLRSPGLACTESARDQYSRVIAKCALNQIGDIGAAQVHAGMAVSHEFYGIRTYGDEEDAARAARRGIWVGKFIPPDEWRAIQTALRTKTQPAE
jgi:endonuclease YncB( thermonuclease family)